MPAFDLADKQGLLSAFCERWKICELMLFGSVARGEGRDIDLLVDFQRDATWTLLDHAAMEEELSGLLGRPVDLVSKKAILRSGNWIRRQEIFSATELLYAA